MADLVVELHGTQVGVLTGPWRTFDFVTDPAAVTVFGIDSTILSAAELVEETLTTVRDLTRTQSPHGKAQPGLDKDITRFTSNLLSGRTIGGM
jgi:hypothetical protein